MLKRILCALTAIMLVLSAASALTYDPIYVDGNGNVVTVTAAPGSSSGGSSGGSSGNAGVMAPCTDTPTPTDDPNAVPAWYYEPTAQTAFWRGERVTIQSLGSVLSIIQNGREKIEVTTCSLEFDVTAAEGKQLAVITPNSAGTVRVFKKASAKATVLNRAMTGTIVPVISAGKRFTLIHYDDCIGYVQTSVLTFISPATQPVETAYVSVNGKVRSRTATVKVRQKPSAYSRILTELPVGTHVCILSTSGEWTEIEGGGMRCWILTKYLTVLTEEEAKETPFYINREYEFIEPNHADVSLLPSAENTPMPTAVVLH